MQESVLRLRVELHRRVEQARSGASRLRHGHRPIERTRGVPRCCAARRPLARAPRARSLSLSLSLSVNQKDWS